MLSQGNWQQAGEYPGLLPEIDRIEVKLDNGASGFSLSGLTG